MTQLANALAMIRSDSITGDQTTFIDAALFNAHCDDIPNEDTLSVINYIDLQLAHNPVSQEVRDHLDRLHNQLRQRQGVA